MSLWALAAGTVVSGLIGAKSASSAAKTQAKSADRAADVQYELGNRSLDIQQNAFDYQKQLQKPIYDIGLSNLNRYNNALSGGFRATPGYQFQKREGENALSRTASARGMRLSGAALKDAARFNQGIADSEYDNYLNRIAALAGISQTAGSSLSSAAGSYAGGASSINAATASGVGNALQTAGAARASGYTGVGNALSGTLAGIGNIAGMAQAGYLGASPGWGINPTYNPYTGAAY